MVNEFDYQLEKDAIAHVIEFLKWNEPRCFPCENCVYGYKTDEQSLKNCEYLQKLTKENHIHWEKKMQKWEKKFEKIKRKGAELYGE